MRFTYDRETDRSYLTLSESPLENSQPLITLEVDEYIILDFDRNGAPFGIDITNASERLALQNPTLNTVVDGVKRELQPFAVLTKSSADIPDVDVPASRADVTRVLQYLG